MGRVLLVVACLVAVLGSSLADKPLPQFTDKAFTAKFQIVLVDQASTFYGIEKYDESQGMSSMEIVVGDTATRVVFDYKGQVVKDIQYSYSSKNVSACNLVTMDKALSDPSLGLKDNFHFLGGWRTQGSKALPHMFSSKSIFTLNTTKPFTYQGTKNIDGVEADHWSAPMVWTDDKDNIQVNYYFTSTAWAAAESQQSKVYPLRIEVNGTKIQTNKKPKDIHHFYEYLDFVGSDRLPSDAFDIPGGALCQSLGAVPTVPVPSIPNVITYNREIVDKTGNVNFATVVYDRKMKLMSINSGQSEVLYDFNAGVRYESKGMACNTRAIDPTLDSNSKMNGYFVEDIGPAEFFLLNNSLTYMGQGHSREISATLFGTTYDQKPFDTYFGKLGWNFEPKYNTPPLSMDRDGKHYNFFNFKNTASSLRTSYLWGACRSFNRRNVVKVIFYSKRYTTQEEIFTDANVAKISDAIAKQSWLAYSQVQIILGASFYDRETSRATVYARFYGPPRSEFMYRKSSGYKLVANGVTTKQKTFHNVDDNRLMMLSSQVCEDTAASTPFLCRSFDLCKKSDGSYTMTMYPKLPATGVSMSQNSACDHYTRSVDTLDEVTLDVALTNLQDSVTKGFLTVNLQTRWRPAVLTGVAIEPVRHKIQSDNASPRRKFRIAFRMSVKNTETVAGISSSEDCFAQCVARDIYKCKAVRWCYTSNTCSLSSEAPYKNASATGSNACLTYKRSFVSEFKAMPGLTMPFVDKYSYTNIADANTCASKCVETKDIACESFDYCKDTKECLLSKTHIYSVPEGEVKNITPSCSHYSKNYILDFDIATKTGLSSDDKHGLDTIEVSSPQQCAYLCRNGYGQGCVQFDYCSDKKVCHIATKKSKSYVANVAKQHCDTYTLTDVQKAVSSGKLTQNKGTTYSNGSFAGLAIAMVAVGLVMGAVLLFVLHRRGSLNRLTG